MRVFTTKDELRTAIDDYFNGVGVEEDIGTWDTSQITDMSYLFEDINQISINPITLNWDTSNVVDMSFMFNYCKQDFILNFNTENVTEMGGMFYDATNFNQPLNFNTINVTDMSYMFENATNFNQPLNFDTSNVTNIYNMFYNIYKFNQPIYFKSQNWFDYSIFENSPFEGSQDKYILSAGHYYKLLLFYILTKINTELLFLCDEFEEYC